MPYPSSTSTRHHGDLTTMARSSTVPGCWPSERLKMEPKRDETELDRFLSGRREMEAIPRIRVHVMGIRTQSTRFLFRRLQNTATGHGMLKAVRLLWRQHTVLVKTPRAEFTPPICDLNALTRIRELQLQHHFVLELPL